MIESVISVPETDYRVYKYMLDVKDEQTIWMHEDHAVLSVQPQAPHRLLCMWACVNTKSPIVLRTFRVIGTGHHIPDFSRLQYLATVQMREGALVWHVFSKR